ncbi:MAG: hypothetical protein M1520_00995 [Candidatus Marsarchaeota archaeon]|nr:hypothetical protein [Candidatus Marsarchaeota archaeon]
MQTTESFRLGKSIIISGNRVEIEGKPVKSINELIVYARDSRERQGISSDSGKTYLISTGGSKGGITSADISITNKEVKVGGILANSIEELKMLMRIEGTRYEEKQNEEKCTTEKGEEGLPGGRFLSWLLSRQT